MSGGSCCSFFSASSSCSEQAPMLARLISSQLNTIIREIDLYLQGRPTGIPLGKTRLEIARGSVGAVARGAEIDADLTTCKVQLMQALKSTAQALRDATKLKPDLFNRRVQQWYRQARKIGWLGRQLTTLHRKTEGAFEALFYKGAIGLQLDNIQTSMALSDAGVKYHPEEILVLQQSLLQLEYTTQKQEIVEWAGKFAQRVTHPSCIDSICPIM